MFNINLEWGGQQYEVVWDDGELRGDPQAVEMIEWAVDVYKGMYFGISAGPGTDRDFLKNPFIAICFLQRVFPGVTFSGDVPTLPYEEGVIY
ncbi:MAG: hypothetical protein ACOYCE_09275 [Limnochordia bacterium]|jgi:hypothetical protein